MTQRPFYPVFVDEEFKPNIIMIGGNNMGLYAQIAREVQKLETEAPIIIIAPEEEPNEEEVKRLIESFHNLPEREEKLLQQFKTTKATI